MPVALDVNLLAAQLAGHDTGAAVETYRRLRRRTDLDVGETAAAAALYTCLVLNDLPLARCTGPPMKPASFSGPPRS